MITDFSKYKRVFAFGCSFTQYIYPTWANIIYKSMNPNTEFYNFGRAGGGNVFISNRITETNRRYKFNDTDLIMIMWSTFCRIDAYRSGQGWVTPGNIYTQDMISKSTVKELADLDWFMIRDLSIIELTHNFLKNLPCDHIKFLSCPFDFERDNYSLNSDEFPNEIVALYSDLEKEYPVSVYEFRNRKWPARIKYYDPAHNGMFTDYHPDPIDYMEYLLHCKIPLSQNSIDYANQSMKFLEESSSKTKQDIVHHFSECEQSVNDAYKFLW